MAGCDGAGGDGVASGGNVSQPSERGSTKTQQPAPAAQSELAAKPPAAPDLRPTLLLDAATLSDRKQVLNGQPDSPYLPAYKKLLSDADKALQTKPISVMDKTGTPPSGDKHEYMSMAPYWWPDTNKPDGLPYVKQDGKTNPEGMTDKYDKSNWGKMSSSVTSLALAYYFSGKEMYADHAAQLLRVWFLDPATKMNPNMNYGQSVPGRADGRKEGVLESQNLLDIVDDSVLLQGSKAWTDQDHAALLEWIADYLKWLASNKLALDERKSTNNHGTWYDAIYVGLSIADGDPSGAAAYMKKTTIPRIAAQIAPDGSMPLEMSRTRSLHYPLYNLKPFTMLAIFGDKVGVDLWGYASEDGRSVHQAYTFLAPYLNGKPWPYAQIRVENESEFARFMRLAAIRYNDPSYAQAADHILGNGKTTSRINLIAPTPSF
jgi:hypothetical protein